MEVKTERPGGGAGPSKMFLAGHSEDSTHPTLSQLLQVARLRRDHGLNADRAALVAGLAFGEGPA